MQSHYLNRLRSALRGLAANLSVSQHVEHLLSHAVVRTRFVSGDERHYWHYPYQHDIWYKGSRIASYGDSFPLPSHNTNRSAVKRYVKRQVCLHSAAAIGIVGCMFIMSLYLFP